MTPCCPSLPMPQCPGCLRYLPAVAEAPGRIGVVLDATVVQRDGEPCPLRVEGGER